MIVLINAQNSPYYHEICYDLKNNSSMVLNRPNIYIASK